MMFLPALQSHPQAELAAICGRNRGRAEEMAAKYNIPRVFVDYREMVRHGRKVYLETLEVSSHTVTAKLKVSSSTFTGLINGKSSLTPEMASRLAKTLGRSPESWLAMQNNYDLWQARQAFNVDEIEKLE